MSPTESALPSVLTKCNNSGAVEGIFNNLDTGELHWRIKASRGFLFAAHFRHISERKIFRTKAIGTQQDITTRHCCYSVCIGSVHYQSFSFGQIQDPVHKGAGTCALWLNMVLWNYCLCARCNAPPIRPIPLY
jgi:hypothetical protein